MTSDGLRLVPLNAEWIKRQGNGLKLAHTTMEDESVLIASSNALQQFVRAHAHDNQAFDPSDLKIVWVKESARR